MGGDSSGIRLWNEETKSPPLPQSKCQNNGELICEALNNNFPQNQKVVVAEEARNKSQQFILNCLPHRSNKFYDMIRYLGVAF